MQEISTRIGDLRQALELLSARRRVALQTAGAKIRALISPEYTRRVRRLVDAFRNVHAANLDLVQLTDALEAREVSWTGLGVCFPPIGSPRDPNSRLASYLGELVELGFINKDEIPAELVHK